MRGNFGRISKFTVPQVQEINDLRKRKEAKSLQARRHMVDLQKQMLDKKMRDESDRVYLNQKEMATSGSIMHQINPHLFEH